MYWMPDSIDKPYCVTGILSKNSNTHILYSFYFHSQVAESFLFFFFAWETWAFDFLFCENMRWGQNFDRLLVIYVGCYGPFLIKMISPNINNELDFLIFVKVKFQAMNAFPIGILSFRSYSFEHNLIHRPQFAFLFSFLFGLAIGLVFLFSARRNSNLYGYILISIGIFNSNVAN